MRFDWRRETEPLVSTAELGRGIWGKGMGDDDSAADRVVGPCQGKLLAAHDGFAELQYREDQEFSGRH